MKKRNILVIPHTPHMHIKVRSFEIAKALSSKNDMYYMLWDEINDFSLMGRIKNIIKNPLKYINGASTRNNVRVGGLNNITLIRDVPRAYAPVWYANWHNSKQIDRLIRQYNIDTVINASFNASPIKNKSSVAYIYDLVDDPFDEGGKRINKERLHFITGEIAKADVVTACSLTLAEYAKNIWKRDVFYLPNGTETASFSACCASKAGELRKRLCREDQRIVGFISNFEMWNGLPFLHEVFRLLSTNKNIILLLVGSGKGLEAMRNEFEKMNNVIMTGPVPPDEIALYFSAIDLGLLPFEKCNLTDRALPLKIIEYGTSGKHVIATPLEELKRQKFPNTHLIERDPRKWAEAIVQALDFRWNPSWDGIFAEFDWGRIAEHCLSRLAHVNSTNLRSTATAISEHSPA